MMSGKVCAILLMCAIATGNVLAQESDERADSSSVTTEDLDVRSDEASIEPTDEESREFKSGYGDIADIGGPESVSSELKRDDELQQPLWYSKAAEQRMAPYFDWKKRLKEDYGFSFGLSAAILYLGSDDDKALAGSSDNQALGGIYRFFGRWGLFARNTGHEGSLQFRLENRSTIGGFIAPDKLGAEMGIAALNPGFGYSGTFGTDISVLNWTQKFADGKAGLSVGRLAFDAYIDNYLLTSFTKSFHNRTFFFNPTIPTTGTGALGAVAEGFVSENIKIAGGFFDANAASGEFDIDTWQRHEFLKYVEVGWTPSHSRYKSDKIQMTYWEIDEQTEDGVPEGSGWALTASTLIDDIYLLFFRAGHSDGGGGAPAEDSVSMGFDWRHRHNQVFSVGLAWAQPSEKTNGRKLRDEYLLEMSYGLRLTQQFSLLPDLQIIKNPALNPDESWVWVAGLRGRFVF